MSIIQNGYRGIHALIITMLLVLGNSPAWSDIIFLKNGDRISGKLVNMRDNTLSLATEYAGAIGISWGQVRDMELTQPMAFIIDNKPIEARVLVFNNQSVLLETVDQTKILIDTNRIGAIEPEAFLLLKERYSFDSRISTGLDVTSGNTDTQNYKLDYSLTAKKLNNRQRLNLKLRREKNDSETTASRYQGLYQYDYFFSKGLFLNSNLSLDVDQLQDLRRTVSLGVGIGYQLLSDRTVNVSLETGINYVVRDFRDEDNKNEGALRFALGAKRLLAQNIELFHNNEILALLEDDNYLIKSSTGIRFLMNNNLTSSLQFDWDYDKSPSSGDTSADRQFSVVVGYAW